eukprot:TRINITY_DN76727_c0_g1_i1.p1 TRINITY_DN76727_c0_g1~~TRINITY_DN76727_c0_g1_i1.p1  ORF type:complete len:303 (-),score=35.89 TRINITY_DN76727_c0_g1_i1:248-1033(-)
MVRIVSVGTSAIDDILKAPGDDQWCSQSIEFCGGTHLERTSEAVAFVVLEEKAISKGVRRIHAATGDIAVAAMDKAVALGKELCALESQSTPSETEVLKLSKVIDGEALSVLVKANCRQRLDLLKQKIKKARKGKSREAILAAQASLHSAVEVARTQGARYCVLPFDNLDPKSLQQAIQAFDSADVAVFGFAVVGGTVHCVATMPATHQQEKRDAGAWIRAALAPLGGQGGGRPGLARGSVSVSGNDDIETIRDAASAYWS